MEGEGGPGELTVVSAGQGGGNYWWLGGEGKGGRGQAIKQRPGARGQLFA